MLPLVSAALSLAPSLINAVAGHKRSKGVNYQQIIDRYMGMKPTGYFGDEDQAFVDRQLGRTTANIGAAANEGRAMAVRRYLARGIGGPAQERTLGRITQGELRAREEAGADSADAAYGIRAGREGFQQGLVSQALGLEVAGARDNLARKDSQQAAFWNSAAQYIPAIRTLFSGTSPAGRGRIGGGIGSTGNYGAGGVPAWRPGRSPVAPYPN